MFFYRLDDFELSDRIVAAGKSKYFYVLEEKQLYIRTDTCNSTSNDVANEKY